MEHSIAAKYAARPAAQFVRPSARARERRLGLHPVDTFRSAGRQTVLRDPDRAPLASLRDHARSIRRAEGVRPIDGRPRPQVAMTWARSGRSESTRRPRAASAPWRA